MRLTGHTLKILIATFFFPLKKFVFVASKDTSCHVIITCYLRQDFQNLPPNLEKILFAFLLANNILH